LTNFIYHTTAAELQHAPYAQPPAQRTFLLTNFFYHTTAAELQHAPYAQPPAQRIFLLTNFIYHTTAAELQHAPYAQPPAQRIFLLTNFSTTQLLQSYNTLLTLSHLHNVSDGIITLENDALHRSCTRLVNIARPSFSVRASHDGK